MKIPSFLKAIAPRSPGFPVCLDNSTLHPIQYLPHTAENATQRPFFKHASLHLASVAALPLRSKTRNGDPSGPHFLLLFWGSAMISNKIDIKNICSILCY